MTCWCHRKAFGRQPYAPLKASALVGVVLVLLLACQLKAASGPNTSVANVYFLPNTVDGLKPTQSWDAVGSSPSGNIFVSGMDHVSNAALYRFRPADGTLDYVGDARAASQAANNWLPGEAVQKFHTRPLWYNGKVYVATLNYSNLDPNYLLARAVLNGTLSTRLGERSPT